MPAFELLSGTSAAVSGFAVVGGVRILAERAVLVLVPHVGDCDHEATGL